MRAVTSIFFYKDDIRFFGPGPYVLLRKIEETGSIRTAAINMDLSYAKALKMLKNAEESLGYSLVEKRIGGKGGGGSKLTDNAKEFLDKYKKYQEECREANQRIYNDIFSE